MSDFTLPAHKSFHVERLDPPKHGSRNCEKRLAVRQEVAWGIVNRNCGDPATLIIRLDHQSWGHEYCPLHARLKVEELLADVSTPVPVKDDAEAD